VDSLGYTITRDEATVKGSMLLGQLTDSITLTPTPTDVALVPILPSTVCVYADALVANLGVTKLTRPFMIDWEYSERFSPVWAIDCAVTGFVAHVEAEPKPILKLLLEADAAGMAFLSKMRLGTRTFIRIQATGGLIVGVYNYLFTHDISAEVINVSPFKDEQGVYAIEWTFQAIYDAGWGKAFNLAVINALTAL
jgi:hypothetical protein